MRSSFYHALKSIEASSERIPLEPVRQLHAKGPSVTLKDVLGVKWRGRVRVFFIQQIVNAGRQVQSFHQVPAEQREVDDPEAGRLGAEQSCPLAAVLKFGAGEYFLLPQRHAEVDLAQMSRRIGQAHPG